MATTYYHGGVPGKRPGELLYPAAHMGLDYTSAYMCQPGLRALAKPKYRPDLVYFTTHLGSARGYAARYGEWGRVMPGDVYVVEPQGPLEPDPDFDHPKVGGVYAASTQPLRITAVVERGVELDRRQQNKECWPYRYNGLWEETHAADGTVLASTEMRSFGVTDEYLALLPKWMDLSEFANDGGLYKRGQPEVRAMPDEILEILAHLGIDTGPHIITNKNIRIAPFVEASAPKNPILLGQFECQECGAQFGGSKQRVEKQTVLDAAVHQAGQELRVVAQFSWGLDGYLHAMLRRSPDRWKWAAVPHRDPK
ncbi:hypothetical protein [Mycolicibacterium wolinskyi]|uniref:hypothetical protein n=1 Tax=Mycolicibacterium wolinskyi TaxID=59750 RepID=UPI000AFCC459|nr:hypothetical protein [Mycolicibacterium wolinskyi]